MNATGFRLLAFGACLLAIVGTCTAFAQAADSDEESGESQRDASGDDQTDTNQNADAEQSASDPDESAAANEVRPGVLLQAFVGFGFGTRSMQRPTVVGIQRLKDAFFPAAEVGLSLLTSPEASFSLGFLLHYQTSLGMTVNETPPFALPNRLAVRSERVELSVAPIFHLGETRSSVGLAFPLGFALRTFWPDAHESMTPRYTLAGPQLRAELVASLTTAVVLRFGPELLWIVALDRSIRRDGVAALGVAVGGAAMLQFQLSEPFAIQLAYRESHASVPSSQRGPSFSDVERYLTIRFVGSL